MSEIERPARPAPWISWLAVVLLMVAVAVAYLSSGREWVILAAGLGLVAGWLISALLRLERRWLVVAVALLLLVVGVGAAWALWVRPDSNSSSPGAAPPRTMAVRYLASGELDGATIVLTETVVFDDTKGAMAILVMPGENPDPLDWSSATAVGGVPSLVRTRTIRASDATLISSTFAVPLDLGEFPAPGGSATLVPGDGSQVVLIAPTGAFGGSSPASTATNPSRDGAEETTIPVDRDITEFSLTVLAQPMRNPAGHWYHDAVAWGPLPWLIGGLVALIGSVLWDRLLRLVGLSGRRPAQRDVPPPAAGTGGS
jgi:hypothetical protein